MITLALSHSAKISYVQRIIITIINMRWTQQRCTQSLFTMVCCFTVFNLSHLPTEKNI